MPADVNNFPRRMPVVVVDASLSNSVQVGGNQKYLIVSDVLKDNEVVPT